LKMGGARFLFVGVLLYVLLAAYSVTSAPLPVVLWHGMGDSCCNPLSLGTIKEIIESYVPGIYVYSLQIGSSFEEDVENGFLLNINKQVDMACDLIKNNSQLAGGFNAIGFSQGGQFLRAYVQRCNKPPVRNLVSLGGQHQGVFGFPRCPGVNYTLCEYVRKLLNYGAYLSFVQNTLVQAEYWQDPLNYAEYLAKNIFLPDINNQLTTKNPQYKANLLTLNKLALVKFTLDGMVQPRESEWFEFYKPGSDKEIVPLRESPLYKEDWLGLQVLDKGGKLDLIECPGDHLQFTDKWFHENVITPYLT